MEHPPVERGALGVHEVLLRHPREGREGGADVDELRVLLDDAERPDAGPGQQQGGP